MDFQTYKGIYNSIASHDLNTYFQISEIEKGFVYLCKIMSVISKKPQTFFFISSLIINFLIVSTIKKNSTIFELSMYLFITTYCYYSSMNVVRQWIAAAIIFYGFDDLVKRNWKRYFILIFLASQIHSSSIIMILVYYLVNIPTKSKYNYFLIASYLFFNIFYNYTFKYLFDIIEQTKYSSYLEEFVKTGRGVNPLRIIVYIIPIIIVFIFYKKIKTNNNNNKFDVIINLCILNSAFMLLGGRHAYFARMCILLDSYSVLLIPYICKISNSKGNRLIYFIILICYFLYSYMLLQGRDAGIIPYNWIFS